MKKKLSIVILGTGITVLVLFGLLPTLLSSDMVLDQVLARINDQPGTSLKIAGCSIGWRRGLVCSDLAYTDYERGLDLHVDKVLGSQGVLALLAAPKNFGTIRVQQPLLTLTEQPTVKTPAPGSLSPNDELKRKTQAAQSSSVAVDKTKPPFWDALVVSLAVENGRFVDRRSKSMGPGPEGNFSATASLAAGTVKYAFQWLAGAGPGKLRAEGFVNLPANRSNFLDTLVARMELQITDLKVGDLLSMAGPGTGIPEGSGLLNGALTMTGAGPDTLDVVGTLDCTDLVLTGGVVGPDHPRLEQVTLRIDGSKKGENNWRIAQFELEGDPGRLSVVGEYGSDSGQVMLTGSVRLPVLLPLFPHLFHLRETTALSRGEFKLSAELSRQGDRQRITADAGIDNLQGAYNDVPFSWDKPLAFEFAGERTENGLRMEQLEMTTPFFKARGRGTATDFSLQAEADLEKGTFELGQLVALPWTGKGTLELKATSRLLKDSGYGIDLQAESPNFVLSKDGQVVLPEHPLNINGSLRLLETWLQGRAIGGLQVHGSIWPGTFSLTAEDLKRSGTRLNAGYDLTTRLHLERLSRLMRNFKILPSQISLAGELNGSVSGFIKQTGVILRQLDLRADDFICKQGETAVGGNTIALRTKRPAMDGKSPIGLRKLLVTDNMVSFREQGFGLSLFDWAKKVLILRDMQLRSHCLDLDIEQLVIDDLKQPLQFRQARLDGRADLAALAGSALFQTGADVKNQVSGQGRFSLVSGQKQARPETRIELVVPDMEWKRNGKTLLNGEEVRLSSRCIGLLSRGELNIDQLELRSPYVALQAGGTLDRTGVPRLVLTGTQQAHTARLAELVSVLTGSTITGHGSRQQDFSLDLRLEKEGLKTALFTSVFSADSLRWSGVEAGALSLPLNLADGVLEAGLHGTLNGGRLDGDGTYMLSAEPSRVTLPPGTEILSGVQLDKPINEAVLKKIHPLFGLLTEPSGTIDVRMDSFSWPVVAGGSRQAEFTAVFDVSKVEIDGRGILNEVLALMQLENQPLTLKESEITCSGRQGRIRCAPVRILVADSVMTLSGSVGMDKDLEYQLEVPITERLVGREGFRVMKGGTLTVPVRGTLTNPEIDKEKLAESLAKLTAQVADRSIRKQLEKLLPGFFNNFKW